MAGIEDCYTVSRGSTKTLGNFVKVCPWPASGLACTARACPWSLSSAEIIHCMCKSSRASITAASADPHRAVDNAHAIFAAGNISRARESLQHYMQGA